MIDSGDLQATLLSGEDVLVPYEIATGLGSNGKVMKSGENLPPVMYEYKSPAKGGAGRGE
jgi:hypothetical protein